MKFRVTTKPISWSNGVQAQIEQDKMPDLDMVECRNILIMPDGIVVPRTSDRLKKLQQYVKKKFGNPYDKRTKAYRYMIRHDSEHEWLITGVRR